MAMNNPQYGHRHREREDKLREGMDIPVIYAAGGWVIYEMPPGIAEELAHVLPGKGGWEQDAGEILEAAWHARGNSPNSRDFTPPPEMSINEAQAWKEGLGHGMFVANLLQQDINPFNKENNGTKQGS